MRDARLGSNFQKKIKPLGRKMFETLQGIKDTGGEKLGIGANLRLGRFKWS